MFQNRIRLQLTQWLRARVVAIVLIPLWGLCALAGVAWMGLYASEAGEQLVAPQQWPCGTSLEHSTDSATLLVFLHPRCPCSTATIAELERLLTGLPCPVSTQLIYGIPEDADAEWLETCVWDRGARLPNARRILDENGRLAQQFGARTSGDCLLYFADGSLAFRGGITQARGHEGDSRGGTALFQAIRDKRRQPIESLVYGCPLVLGAEESVASEAQNEDLP